MKRKYMVKDKIAAPYSAANACQGLQAPWIFVDSNKDRGTFDVWLTEPRKEVINALVKDGFSVENSKGELCVVDATEEGAC